MKVCLERVKLSTHIPALVSAIALWPTRSGRAASHPVSAICFGQMENKSGWSASAPIMDIVLPTGRQLIGFARFEIW